MFDRPPVDGVLQHQFLLRTVGITYAQDTIGYATLHRVGGTYHLEEQPLACLFRQLEGQLVREVLPLRSEGGLQSQGIAHGESICWMTPFAHTMQRHAQRDALHLVPLVEVRLVENIRHLEVVLLGNARYGSHRREIQRIGVCIEAIRSLDLQLCRSTLCRRSGQRNSLFTNHFHTRRIGQFSLQSIRTRHVQDNTVIAFGKRTLSLEEPNCRVASIGTSELVVGTGERDLLAVPSRRESRTKGQHIRQEIGLDANQTLYQRAAGDAHGVTEVAVALATSGIVVGNLTYVAGTATQVHTIDQSSLEESVCLVGATGLPESQSGVHLFGQRHVVDGPTIRLPTGGAQSVQSIETMIIVHAHIDVRDMLLHPLHGATTLLGRTYLTINGMIDRPQRRILVLTLQTMCILALGPDALVLQPEFSVHGVLNLLCLSGILLGGSDVAQQPTNLCCLAVGPQVIGRTMGHGTSIIIEAITRPYTTVGIIKAVIIRIIDSFFPRQVTLDDGPECTSLFQVTAPTQVPKQLVDEDQVHVVMVDLLGVVRISANVTRRKHRITNLLGGTRLVLGGVQDRYRLVGRHIDNLRCGIAEEVTQLAILPTHHVAHIGGTPTGQRDSPTNSAVLPNALSLVPDAVGSSRKDILQRIDHLVGRHHLVVGNQSTGHTLALQQHGLQGAERVGLVTDGKEGRLVQRELSRQVVDGLSLR